MHENTPSPKPANEGRISENIVYFSRVLRDAGLPVGPASVVDAIKAVQLNGLHSREDLYWTLQAVFLRKNDQRPVFDQAFNQFWQTQNLIEKMLALLSPVAPSKTRKPEKPQAAQARVAQAIQKSRKQKEPASPASLEVNALLSVSGHEKFQVKDFEQMSAQEINEARLALSRMRLPRDTIVTRRKEPSQRGMIDPRRTLRASLRTGNDGIDLKYRQKREASPPIVSLCDISGSMAQYTRIFLHFLHALNEQRQNSHTFVFGTRLTNITRQLKLKDPDEALDACTKGVKDWSGGTRIATALHRFNQDWAQRVLNSKTTLLLVTDGLERDSNEDLAKEMDRLRRSCRHLIWLNPLLRYDGFEAKAKGIQAMLPYVDDFRSLHSLKSVQDLCNALQAGPTMQAPRSLHVPHN
ncbi:vWA domain-containing protein [Flexibacterium corallicola]|uniref:vWA domain-containing protein n=1 Tax=Flexibacterium corallicola TaxID=3037259 RepID=UPI00286EF140|nr:VWA domain-containing protein [Pseudovibrio sp. M1P-2-3]